jgi:hypothetical protein
MLLSILFYNYTYITIKVITYYYIVTQEVELIFAENTAFKNAIVCIKYTLTVSNI